MVNNQHSKATKFDLSKGNTLTIFHLFTDISPPKLLKLRYVTLQQQQIQFIYTTKEAKNSDIENKQREEWLKHKGMDTFDAMKLYIEKVKELAKIYPERQADAAPSAELKPTPVQEVAAK